METSSRDGNTRAPYLPLRNLYAGQEAAVRTEHGAAVQQLELDMEQQFQVGRGVHQVCILSPCLFKFYAEYVM